MERVDNAEVLTLELVCKVGSLPSTYLDVLWVLIINWLLLEMGLRRFHKRLVLW